MSKLTDHLREAMGLDGKHKHPNKHFVIVDGDFGGDELQLLAVMAARPDKFFILGATATFGNAPLDKVAHNAGCFLRLLDKDQSVPLYLGAKGPTGGPEMKSVEEDGDGAHGNDGKGGIELEPSREKPERKAAVDYILDELKQYPDGTITITATGPLTNIAQAILKDPETMKKVKEIVVMGGCTEAMPGYPTYMDPMGNLVRTSEKPYLKQGNVTDTEEFNAWSAPQDFKTVMDSGLPITLMPMNLTHQLTFTPKREQGFMSAMRHIPNTAKKIAALIKAPELFDKLKFDISSVMHDVHTALYLLHGEQYEGRKGRVSVNEEGMTTFTPDNNGTITVMEQVKDANTLMAIVTESFVRTTRHLRRRNIQLENKRG